eukprot:3909175-Heterocapsa_arctica.AAC.1
MGPAKSMLRFSSTDGIPVTSIPDNFTVREVVKGSGQMNNNNVQQSGRRERKMFVGTTSVSAS